MYARVCECVCVCNGFRAALGTKICIHSMSGGPVAVWRPKSSVKQLKSNTGGALAQDTQFLIILCVCVSGAHYTPLHSFSCLASQMDLQNARPLPGLHKYGFLLSMSVTETISTSNRKDGFFFK